MSNHVTTASLALALACADPVEQSPPPCDPCALVDANNYRYSADLQIDVQRLRSQSDATIDWSHLGADVQGHTIDPARDVDQALIGVFLGLEPDEIAAGLADETVQQSDVSMFVMCTPEDTSCQLSDFSVLGSTFDPSTYFTEAQGTWLVALTSERVAGARSLLFLQADEDSEQTLAEIDDDSSALAVEVDLTSLSPVPALARTPGLRVDWSELTRDGLDNTLSTYAIDELWVARYDHPLDELQAQVFDLRSEASELWTADIGGVTSVDLSTLQGDTAFPGVSGDDTWLLALWCTTCTTPAPRFLTVLSPTPGG